MDLIAVAAFTDNYIWMLHDGGDAIVVDPGDAAPVIEALDRLRLRLAGILVTHHHGDHVGGIEGLRSRLQGPVHGPAREAIPQPFVPHAHGETLDLLALRFSVIDVPGHTAGHIAYYAEPPGQAPLLFCGDTLFSGGCGRLFEGTPAQMHTSLQALAALPGNTRVCCAHEYTLSNLRFAQAVEPANAELQRYRDWCEARRASHQPTLPSSIALERQINPFLRCSEPAVQAAAHAQEPTLAANDPVAVLGRLRQWKNEFR
ncbi:hydroxyacylglutathione hydrolase [Pelomonas sp. KK5]|uniref:hydroxyacylglutathione hydrolase n=1 Tax=Pelomonas sp. KK5 TaxID=1855730 RepID=UPI00097C5CDB|nr:hydroxyacylglutathione hydrolase [Pelomonas sp. KK5]